MTIKGLLFNFIFIVLISLTFFFVGYAVGEQDARHEALLNPKTQCHCGTIYEQRDGYWEKTLTNCSVELPTECEREDK